MKYINRCLKIITCLLCLLLCASSITSSLCEVSEVVQMQKEHVTEEIPFAQDTSSKIKTVSQVSDNTEEFRAVWLSFLEFSANGYTETQFKQYIDSVFDRCVELHLNAVIAHVRPFSDAMYASSYYPWSKYASGKDGKNPGYDPLEYMVKAAHARELELHAWINPYRISNVTTKTNKLPKTSYAYKWSHSKNKAKHRNVLAYSGRLYYNPAKKDVQNLICNGVKEIVKNYDVDGIHFDDYFYPNMGTQYKKVFDAKEYKAYKKRCSKNGQNPVSIARWRRNNVNRLIRTVYKSIKKIDKDCIFGISPAGNLDNLYLTCANYVDVETWMGNNGYIDYICPQIYWSFTQKTCPYKQTVDRWASISRKKNVSLYIGIASYRAGISKKEALAVTDVQWSKANNILKRQIQYNRKTNKVDGFALFSYQSLNPTKSRAKKEIKNMLSVLD